MASLAKEYSNTKYSLSIIDTCYTITLFFMVLGTGFSLSLEDHLRNINLSGGLLIGAFFLVISFLFYLINLPLNFYSSFILEHKFNLSKQKAKDWWLDQLKSGALAYVISLILILAFYGILNRFSNSWWLILSIFWIGFSLILAKLTPVLIIPLFFKYKKLDDGLLRQRILNLAYKMQIKLMDVFEIDLSKKTLKANAAFTGLGRTRRVILADTLKDKYNYDEIEVILAHEFAHYRLRHILKLILINSLVTLGLFFIIFKTNGYCLTAFKLDSLRQLASLPLVFIYFMLFGIICRPLEAYLSRRFEKEADCLALKTTQNPEAFISLMDKLAAQNLADRSPHPIIKFFFFDHPPIDERIQMARDK